MNKTKYSVMVAISFLLFTAGVMNATANSLDTKGLTVVKTVLEEEPQFPGGMAALKNYIGKTMVYPKMAYNSGTEGTVKVGFIVDELGYVVDVKVIRGINHYLDQEALRVVKEMPQWTSGIVNGEKVSTSMVLPITFKIS